MAVNMTVYLHQCNRMICVVLHLHSACIHVFVLCIILLVIIATLAMLHVTVLCLQVCGSEVKATFATGYRIKTIFETWEDHAGQPWKVVGYAARKPEVFWKMTSLNNLKHAEAMQHPPRRMMQTDASSLFLVRFFVAFSCVDVEGLFVGNLDRFVCTWPGH